MKLNGIRVIAWALAGILGMTAVAGADSVVKAGYELDHADPASFGGAAFTGVPLGTFNFGSGAVNVGNADAIIRRLNDVSGPVGTTSLVLEALQMESVAPINFAGLGVDNYFFTLQSARGGPASTGSETINFADDNGGTFSSSLDVFFDIRKGSLSGAIVFSEDLVASTSDNKWDRTPPANATVIDGINQFLLGAGDRQGDFWADGAYTDTFPTGASFTLNAATSPAAAVPTPAALPAGVVLIGGLAVRYLRGRKAARV